MRLSGVVAGPEGAIPVANATMSVAGAEPVAVAAREPFDLILEGGDRVRVELAPAARLFGPERSARGPWGEVEGETLARLYRDRAPGPHIAVKLRGCAIAVGDPVEIFAEVLEHEAVDGPAAPREAPERRISLVRAFALSWGPTAAAKMEAHVRATMPALRRETFRERKPFAWKKWGIIALVVVGLGLLAIAMISSRVVLVDVVSFLASAGVVLYDMNESEAPRFRVGGEAGPDPERMGAAALSGLCLLVAAGWTVVHAFIALFGAPPGTELAVPLVSAVALAISTVSLYVATRYPARIAKLLLSADPHPSGLPEGAWGVSSGKVADPTPLETTSVPSAMAVTTSDGEPRFAYEGTFVVETAAGHVEVDPAAALWASRVKSTRNVDGKSIYEEIVPIGGNIAVAGRLKRTEAGAVLASTGPESLVVFATPADQPALDALRGFLGSRRKMLALLPGVAALILVLAAALLGVPHF